MIVKLAPPPGGVGDEDFETARHHPARVDKAEKVIRRGDPRQPGPGGAAQEAEDDRERPVPGFAHQAHGVEIRDMGKRQIQDHRVKVQMGVPVPVYGREPPGGEALELPGDLRAEGIAEAGAEGVRQPGPGRGGNETAMAIGQRGGLGSPAMAEAQMQPDSEPRVAPGDPDRLLRAPFVDHQARLREQPRLVVTLDSLVHPGIKAEIIAGNDQRTLALRGGCCHFRVFSLILPMPIAGTSSLWSTPTAWGFLLPVAVSLLYWIATSGLLAVRTRRRSPAAPGVGAGGGPVVFLRPVKRGVPELEEKARRLLACARAGDRVIFGVNDPGTAAACGRVCAEAPPGVEARVVECGNPPPGGNPKVAKLIAMTGGLGPEAPGLWIISDCELLLRREEMEAFRREWDASGAAALTAGYRFAGAANLPQRLDHLPVWLTLWPGLCVRERMTGAAPGGIGLTLGACTGVRREDLHAIGGWQPLLPYLAEDYRLGASLARAGRPVRLAREVVVTLDSDPMGWREWLLHQHRVALTYRCCDPAGVLGMGLTHGLLWSLPLLLWRDGWMVVATTALVRLATAAINRRLVDRVAGGADEAKTRATGRAGAGGILLAALCEGVFWLAAWLPLPVRWGARRYRIGKEGRLRR